MECGLDEGLGLGEDKASGVDERARAATSPCRYPHPPQWGAAGAATPAPRPTWQGSSHGDWGGRTPGWRSAARA
eukprot:15484057-Alexandrium_andersonii.AAC.1